MDQRVGVVQDKVLFKSLCCRGGDRSSASSSLFFNSSARSSIVGGPVKCSAQCRQKHASAVAFELCNSTGLSGAAGYGDGGACSSTLVHCIPRSGDG